MSVRVPSVCSSLSAVSNSGSFEYSLKGRAFEIGHNTAYGQRHYLGIVVCKPGITKPGDTKSGITKSYFEITGPCVTAVIHSSTGLFDSGVQLFELTTRMQFAFLFYASVHVWHHQF